MADLLHARVRKRFGKRWYAGSVTELWRQSRGAELLAHVAYDDGDEEDLTLADARALLMQPAPKPAAAAAAQEAQPAVASNAELKAPQCSAKKRRGHALLEDSFPRAALALAGAGDGAGRCATRRAATRAGQSSNRKFV
jgi:hypothetical protein